MAIKQRFTYFFAGDGIDLDVWTETDNTGTGTRTMEDSVDGGYSIAVGTGTLDASQINFNDIRQYDFQNSTCLFTMKDTGIAQALIDVGLVGHTGTGNTEQACVRSFDANTNFALITGDASTGSTTEGLIPLDSSFHNYKLVLSSTDVVMDLDGVLDVTKTSNRPTVKLQPVFAVESNSGATTKKAHILNIEAFNT